MGFKGKIVLIGLAAAGTADVVTTPIEDETYGVYVQARAVNAILAGDALAPYIGKRARKGRALDVRPKQPVLSPVLG